MSRNRVDANIEVALSDESIKKLFDESDRRAGGMGVGFGSAATGGSGGGGGSADKGGNFGRIARNVMGLGSGALIGLNMAVNQQLERFAEVNPAIAWELANQRRQTLFARRELSMQNQGAYVEVARAQGSVARLQEKAVANFVGIWAGPAGELKRGIAVGMETALDWQAKLVEVLGKIATKMGADDKEKKPGEGGPGGGGPGGGSGGWGGWGAPGGWNQQMKPASFSFNQNFEIQNARSVEEAVSRIRDDLYAQLAKARSETSLLASEIDARNIADRV